MKMTACLRGFLKGTNEVINRSLVQFPGLCRYSMSAIYLFHMFHASDPHNDSMLHGRNFALIWQMRKIEARNTGQKDGSHLDFNGQPTTPRKTWLLFSMPAMILTQVCKIHHPSSSLPFRPVYSWAGRCWAC